MIQEIKYEIKNINKTVKYQQKFLHEKMIQIDSFFVDIDQSTRNPADIKIFDHQIVYFKDQNRHVHAKFVYEPVVLIEGIIDSIDDFLNENDANSLENICKFSSFVLKRQGFIKSFFAYEMFDNLQKFYCEVLHGDKNVTFSHLISQTGYRLVHKSSKKEDVLNDFFSMICDNEYSKFFYKLFKFAVEKSKKYDSTIWTTKLSERKASASNKRKKVVYRLTEEKLIQFHRYLVHKGIYAKGLRQQICMTYVGIYLRYIANDYKKLTNFFSKLVTNELVNYDEEYQKRMDVVKYLHTDTPVGFSSLVDLIERHFGEDVAKEVRDYFHSLIEKVYVSEDNSAQKTFTYVKFEGNKRQSTILLQAAHFLFTLFTYVWKTIVSKSIQTNGKLNVFAEEYNCNVSITLNKKQVCKFIRFGAKINNFELSKKWFTTKAFDVVRVLEKYLPEVFKCELVNSGRQIKLTFNIGKFLAYFISCIRYVESIDKFLLAFLNDKFAEHRSDIQLSLHRNIFQFSAFVFKTLSVHFDSLKDVALFVYDQLANPISVETEDDPDWIEQYVQNSLGKKYLFVKETTPATQLSYAVHKLDYCIPGFLRDSEPFISIKNLSFGYKVDSRLEATPYGMKPVSLHFLSDFAKLFIYKTLYAISFLELIGLNKYHQLEWFVYEFVNERKRFALNPFYKDYIKRKLAMFEFGHRNTYLMNNDSTYKSRKEIREAFNVESFGNLFNDIEKTMLTATITTPLF